MIYLVLLFLSVLFNVFVIFFGVWIYFVLLKGVVISFVILNFLSESFGYFDGLILIVFGVVV